MDKPGFENPEKTMDDTKTQDTKVNEPDSKKTDCTTSSSSDSGSDKGRKGCCCTRCCHRIGKRFRNCWNGTKGVSKELKDMAGEAGGLGRNWVKRSFTVDGVKETFPIIKWLPKYRLRHLQGDLIAGLTVGLTVIPQGLAYAKVAGLSPEYGLYSAFIGCFVYMLLGTSKDITFGPTAIMSLLTGQFAHPGAMKGTTDPTYAILLSLFAGIIQLAMGIFHVGFIVDYISHPVINSFTTAAAVTIAWGQIKSWFGFKDVPSDFLNQVYWNFKKLPETKLWDFMMGLTCIIVLYAMKKSRSIKWGNLKSRPKRILKYIIWLATTARNAIVVVLASVASSLFISNGLKSPFSLTGTIAAGVPPFTVPRLTLTHNGTNGTETIGTLQLLTDIGPGLAIISILGLVETVAIGKAFARKYGYTILPNQELLAVGAANIVGSFVGAYPVTGSFSRTAVNAQSGVMTPAGGIWTAMLVLLSLAFLTPLFYYIPNSALAAVIIMAVLDMIDFALVLKLWRVKKIDLIPWIVTFVCSLCIGIEYGIIIGVGVSLLFLLYPWATPKFQINFVQITDDANHGTVVITLNQGLAFPGIERFKDKVYAKALSEDHSKSVVLDFSYIANADFTAVEGMHQLLEDFAKRKRKIVVCNLRPEILDTFTRAKLKHFQHTSTVDDAISLLKEEHEDAVKKDEDNNRDTMIVPLDTPDIERCTIYNSESDSEDKTDDEELDKNYIVAEF